MGLVEFAWCLHALHMLSLPIWLGAGLKVLCKHNGIRTSGSRAGVCKAITPTEGEYYGVRLLLVYAIADFFRGIDLCFDCTDGACYAVGGFVPLWLRFAAWAVRDLALLAAVSFQLQYILGWTHKALGLPSPKRDHSMLSNTYIFTLCGLCSSFWALMASNRQSWQAVAVLFVVALNLVWALTNRKLSHGAIQEIESHLSASIESKPEWAMALVTEARCTIRLILTANLVIIVAFTLGAAERIILKNAHWKPFIPDAALGSWVGGSLQPLLSEIPSGEVLIPVVEIVEQLIGWLQFFWLMNQAGKSASMRVPATAQTAQTPLHRYLSSEMVGEAFAKNINLETSQKGLGIAKSKHVKQQ